MFSYQYTPAQAQAIANQWNELANDSNQIDWLQCYTIMHDDFDAELALSGAASIEVSARESKTGNPTTFDIFEHQLTKTGV
jgi:hypothetical protein